jgi:hypothetical protein
MPAGAQDVHGLSDAFLAVTAEDRWPARELQVLVGYLRAEVLGQDADEERLLFPTGASPGVSRLARDHARLRAAIETLERVAAGESTWSPAEPLTIARAGSAYMNLSFDALMAVGWSTAPDPSQALELGDHDPINRGFSLRNAEIVLDGAVDPYFKGFANIVLKLDKNNQTDIELEETYLQSSSLPANLQLKAGQFFAAFGRQNA